MELLQKAVPLFFTQLGVDMQRLFDFYSSEAHLLYVKTMLEVPCCIMQSKKDI